MALSSDQLDSLEIAVRASALLSVVAGVFFFRHAIQNWNKLVKGTSRVLLWWIISDVLQSCFLAISRRFIDPSADPMAPASMSCKVHGFFVVWGFLFSGVWPAMMATNVYLTLFKNKSVADLIAHEYYYHAVVWLGSLAIAAISALCAGPDFFGNAYLWCGISNEYAYWRIYVKFVPIWFVQIYCVVIYVAGGIRIRRVQRRNQFSVASPAINLRGKRMPQAKVSAATPGSANGDVKRTGPQAPNSQLPTKRQFDASLQYAVRTGLHLLTLFTAYTAATINRVQVVVDSDDLNYGLFMAQAILEPLNGFLTVGVFFSTPFFRRFFQTRMFGSSSGGNRSDKRTQSSTSAPTLAIHNGPQSAQAKAFNLKNMGATLTLDGMASLGIVAQTAKTARFFGTPYVPNEASLPVPRGGVGKSEGSMYTLDSGSTNALAGRPYAPV